MQSRNILSSKHKEWDLNSMRIYKNRSAIVSMLCQLPKSTHDPSTFTVDVLRHDVSILYFSYYIFFWR